MNNDPDFLNTAMTVEERMGEREQDGYAKGDAKGIADTIKGTVEMLRKKNFSDGDILEMICGQFGFSEEDGRELLS